MYHLYVCVYFPHNGQLVRTDFPHNALSLQCIVCTSRSVCVCVCKSVSISLFVCMCVCLSLCVCVFYPQRPTRMHWFSPLCTFITMYHLFIYVCIFPTTPTRTHWFSPQWIFPTMYHLYVCVYFPTTQTRTHRFSPQCTFPTMYHLYVCVYVPYNDQLGRTHFPHNALSPQCIVGTTWYV